MHSTITRPQSRTLIVALAAGLFAASAGVAFAKDTKVTLSGKQEVPPVTTKAAGHGSITVKDDHGVSGSVKTSDISGTMAHIHQAASGKNGPVIIPLTKKGDSEWVVPDGAKLTDAQYKAYKDGDLYVNVHTAENKGGEIRAQIKP